MKSFKVAATVFCVALMSVALAPSAKADEWNKKTVITFSGPVEIPGVHLTGWAVLPAGAYVFKLLDSQSDRHIVQIFDKDETTIYATILAIPNYRLKATDKTTITFRERPAGEPEALRAWFYPGAKWGEEFVYPKAKAIALAKDANTTVLFYSDDVAVEVAEPVKSLDAPVVVAMRTAAVMAITPAGKEVQAAEVTAALAPAPAEVAVNVEPAQSLPSTGSSLPLIGLLGFITLIAAVGTRFAAKRV